MAGGAQAEVDLGGLKARLDGRAVGPGDDGWDRARQAFNLSVDQRPRAVAVASSVEDVVATVRFAAERELPLAVQATGHGAAAYGSLEGALLLRTRELGGAELDTEARRARVAAGAVWNDVVTPASERRLAPLSGSSPGVSVVGYTLGGGIGWLSRSFGLAANSVTAAELVTADGELRRVDREKEADLFWALRGGGGSFGAVTALELELFEVQELYAGALFWPWERATEVLQRWRETLPAFPDQLSSLGRIVQVPPLPDLPEQIRGRSFVVVEAAYLGGEADGAELMRPLRELEPEIDTLATVPPAGLAAVHMDPQEPVPGRGDHLLLAELSAEAIDALVGAAGPGSGSPLVSVEVRHLEGALASAPESAGALAAIDAPFATYAVGMAADPEGRAATEAHLERVREAISPWDAGRAYLNFTERRVDAAELFTADAYRRLREIKSAYDPTNLFRANHPIPLAG